MSLAISLPKSSFFLTLPTVLATCLSVSAFSSPLAIIAPYLSYTTLRFPRSFSLHVPSAKSNHDSDDEGILPEDDWRTFRAKLVLSESSTSSASRSSISESATIDASVASDSDVDGIGALFPMNSPIATRAPLSSSSIDGLTPLDPSQWAYDSGKVIEKGAVILGGVEQDFGFGLRQQYFHKAVILVLDHDDKTFTKGIILNRPSNRVMEDDVNEGLKWKVWFGGDVQGLDTIFPDIVCLHSLKSDAAIEASFSVMKDIQWTSFQNAKQLVKRGLATVQDFWLFAGYAGWGPRQLSGELDRKSWYMCATDSQTLLKELARQSSGVDPRDAGLETWEMLMKMIGRGEMAEKVSANFDDLMLKEWVRGNLLLKDQGFSDAAGVSKNPSFDKSKIIGEEKLSEPMQKKIGTVDSALSAEISAGTLLRASSANRSPFLLQNQEFHKSLVLVILEDQNVSVCVLLNHPSMKACEVKSVYGSGSYAIPLRYGGNYAVKGVSPFLWLHCKKKLREFTVGTPFTSNITDGIYKCSQDQAVKAISQNIAVPQDFLVISGVCVWPKSGGSLVSEVSRGVFEIVPPSHVEEVFQLLQQQDVLTVDSLTKNVNYSMTAWEVATDKMSATQTKELNVLTFEKKEGIDKNDDAVVFNSDKKVSDLADEALRKWISTFLLGSPTLA